MRYPEEASNRREQGVVYTSFVILPDGKITNIEIKEGMSQSIDREALRIIRIMPEWKPWMADGKPVPVRYTLPIRFKVNR